MVALGDPCAAGSWSVSRAGSGTEGPSQRLAEARSTSVTLVPDPALSKDGPVLLLALLLLTARRTSSSVDHVKIRFSAMVFLQQ